MEKATERMERIRKALTQIWQKAKEDGKITADEQAIIDIVTSSIEKLEATFEKAAEDGIITQDERNELYDLEEKMYSDTYFTAMSDEVLTEEEALLLKTLILTINPKSDISWIEKDLQKS